MVRPFARALGLLRAFAPEDGWLGNRDLASRTGLPASTIKRIAQSLVLLGYLRYDAQGCRYRLAAPVLALGYGAVAGWDVDGAVRARMQAIADQQDVHVSLSSRDRLDVVVIESCGTGLSPASRTSHIGARVGIAASPLGWALLAGLPQLERRYLIEDVERRNAREWPHLRRRMAEAIAQVNEFGFCTSSGDCAREMGIVAAPMFIDGQATRVVSCIGPAARMTRARAMRELGPRLRAMSPGIERMERGA